MAARSHRHPIPNAFGRDVADYQLLIEEKAVQACYDLFRVRARVRVKVRVRVRVGARVRVGVRVRIGARVRARVRVRFQLTCSVGKLGPKP